MEAGSTGSAAELYVSNIKADLDKLRSQLPVGFYETREYCHKPCNNIYDTLRTASSPVQRSWPCSSIPQSYVCTK